MLGLRVLLVSALALLTACGGPMTLQMSPRSPAYVDESSVSPRLQTGSFDRVMIVPPSGTAGVEFQENLAAIERSFIARGITVISSAITSRVLLDDPTRDRQRTELGIQLSEVERALLLAKESNADAVLQIGTWEWVDPDQSDLSRRYFVQDKATKSLPEVTRADYDQAPVRNLFRWSLGGRVLAFTGRLINVENGEVVASFKIDVPQVNVVEPLIMVFDKSGEVQSQSYDPARDERKQQAAAGKAVAELFDRLALLLSQRR